MAKLATIKLNEAELTLLTVAALNHVCNLAEPQKTQLLQVHALLLATLKGYFDR